MKKLLLNLSVLYEQDLNFSYLHLLASLGAASPVTVEDDGGGRKKKDFHSLSFFLIYGPSQISSASLGSCRIHIFLSYIVLGCCILRIKLN